jgi:hypothetical protein
MKSFTAALLISSVVAQSTTQNATAAVKDAANTVGNFFSGLIKDYATDPA